MKQISDKLLLLTTFDMTEEIELLRHIEKQSTSFQVSPELLLMAMKAQFAIRAEEIKRIARPTRITLKSPHIEEYFDFKFEVAVFCARRNLKYSVNDYLYTFV